MKNFLKGYWGYMLICVVVFTVVYLGFSGLAAEGMENHNKPISELTMGDLTLLIIIHAFFTSMFRRST